MGAPEIRRLAAEDTITVEVLRDFLLAAIRHDALADVVIERLAFHAERHQLDAAGLAATLPELIGDLLHAATREDWIAVAAMLIEDAEENLPGGEGR